MALSPLLLAPVAWSVWFTSEDAPATYHIDPGFCADVLPRFREDAFLSWQTFGCADVHAGVHTAFEAWRRATTTLTLRPVDDELADVVVVATTLRVASHVAVANATDRSRLRIQVDEAECWYTDRAFCHTVDRHLVLLLSVMGVAWCAHVAAAVALLCHEVRPFRAVGRLVVWAGVLAFPLVFVGALLPCMRCHDFVAVVLHEVGHVLGLGHSDTDGRRWCGCGANATECDANPDAVMHSLTTHRPTACLTHDDADAVRTLHGGDCGSHIWCDQTPSLAGGSRLAVALVYSFVFAWGVVGLRDLGRAT